MCGPAVHGFLTPPPSLRPSTPLALSGLRPPPPRSGLLSLHASSPFLPTEMDEATNTDPDHPVLKDPVTLTDRFTKEQVTIRRHGACVTSYKTPDYDVFFVRPDAVLDGSKPISGGVPFCFPQFGPGEIQQHGFARNVNWTCADWREEAAGGSRGFSFTRDTARAVYELYDTKYTYNMWPHKFLARYSVDLSAGMLTLDFRVKNLGGKPFTFTGALHTYYAVRDIDAVEIRGDFKGKKYLDKVSGETKTEDRETLTIKEFTDSVYYGMDGDVELVDGDRSVLISPVNEWKDLVVWNPYGEEKMGYKNFVCIENACLEPQEVPAGEWWDSSVEIRPYCNDAPAFMQAMEG
uniref:glucose-6-phosphate 1-epimerase n=1 Tax=Hemiselmis tepida TaxID=464990 RepID=A0A7S0VZ96_9CRYP|mmetsp:Transcript_29999/g.75958  ORF Transcript_29999/g.75958 Transcript_29999/m.75958 type:complete len:349 (+) Transcript_29999:2-1048(+)